MVKRGTRGSISGGGRTQRTSMIGASRTQRESIMGTLALLKTKLAKEAEANDLAMKAKGRIMLIEEDIELWKQGFFGGSEDEIREGIEKLEAERQSLIEAALVKRLEAAEYDRISRLPPEEQAAALAWLHSGNFIREALEKKREQEAYEKKKRAYGWIDIDEELHKIERSIRQLENSYNAKERADELEALLVEKHFLDKWFVEKYGHTRKPRTPTPPPAALEKKAKKKKQKSEAQIKAEKEAMEQLLAAQAALKEEEMANQHEEFKRRAAARKAAKQKDDPEWKKEYLRKARLHGYATKIQTIFRRFDSRRLVAERREEIRMYPFKLAASIQIQAAARRFIIRCRLPTIRHDKIIYDKRRRRMLQKREARLKREEEERILEAQRLREMRVAFKAEMTKKAAAAAEVRERRHERMHEKQSAMKDEVEDRIRLQYGEGHVVRRDTANRLKRHATAAKEAVREYSMAWPPPQQHDLPPSPMASCFDIRDTAAEKAEEAGSNARGSMERCKEKWMEWKVAARREEEQHSSHDVIVKRLMDGRPTAEPFADETTKSMLKDLRQKQKADNVPVQHLVGEGDVARLSGTAPQLELTPPSHSRLMQSRALRGAQTTRSKPGHAQNRASRRRSVDDCNSPPEPRQVYGRVPRKRALRRRSVEEITREWARPPAKRDDKRQPDRGTSQELVALQQRERDAQKAVAAAVAAAQAGIDTSGRVIKHRPVPPAAGPTGRGRRYHA